MMPPRFLVSRCILRWTRWIYQIKEKVVEDKKNDFPARWGQLIRFVKFSEAPALRPGKNTHGNVCMSLIFPLSWNSWGRSDSDSNFSSLFSICKGWEMITPRLIYKDPAGISNFNCNYSTMIWFTKGLPDKIFWMFSWELYWTTPIRKYVLDNFWCIDLFYNGKCFAGCFNNCFFLLPISWKKPDILKRVWFSAWLFFLAGADIYSAISWYWKKGSIFTISAPIRWFRIIE